MVPLLLALLSPLPDGLSGHYVGVFTEPRIPILVRGVWLVVFVKVHDPICGHDLSRDPTENPELGVVASAVAETLG